MAVVNSAAYGFSQRKRSVYTILARKQLTGSFQRQQLQGIMSRAFPFNPVGNISYVDIKDPFCSSGTLILRSKTSRF